MTSFPTKLKNARVTLNLSQNQLSKQVGISSRSIFAYEAGAKTPRPATLLKLAKALKVSSKYLSDDACENPVEDIEKDGYIEKARALYGLSGAIDVDFLLEQNKALFAGGELSQEEKNAYFEAVMTAYITCKEAAKIKFGPKDK